MGFTPRYDLTGYEKGEPQFKPQESDSPTVDSIRLVSYRLKPRTDKVTIDIIGSSLDDLLKRKSNLDQFFIKAMDAQVARNNGGRAFWYYLAERPLNTSTKTYKSEIINGSVKLPQLAYGPNILSSIFEDVVLTIRLHPYVSASVLTILNAVAANNGSGNFVDIAASGATAITGDLPAPLSVEVVGGDTTTKRLLLALCQNGNPTNFKNIYWAKDATLTNNTVALNGDTALDGNTTHNGTRTTAADTAEHKTHQWVNTTNMFDQIHKLQGFARLRCNTAGRYSVRFRVGLTDGTNNFFPPSNAASDGFVTAAAQAVGTHSGNHLAWVPIGEFDLPPVFAGGATVYGIVIEMYSTCSDITAAPTLDFDGLFVFPVGEGPVGTGIVQATYPFATGAAGVASALISALPGDSKAALLNGSNVATFPGVPDAGAPLFGVPLRAARLLMALIDSDNNRHDYTSALLVTVIHELRHSNLIGV